MSENPGSVSYPVRVSRMEKKIQSIVGEAGGKAVPLRDIVNQIDDEKGTVTRKSTVYIAIQRLNEKVGVEIIKNEKGKGYKDALASYKSRKKK